MDLVLSLQLNKYRFQGQQIKQITTFCQEAIEQFGWRYYIHKIPEEDRRPAIPTRKEGNKKYEDWVAAGCPNADFLFVDFCRQKCEWLEEKGIVVTENAEYRRFFLSPVCDFERSKVCIPERESIENRFLIRPLSSGEWALCKNVQVGASTYHLRRTCVQQGNLTKIKLDEGFAKIDRSHVSPRTGA